MNELFTVTFFLISVSILAGIISSNLYDFFSRRIYKRWSLFLFWLTSTFLTVKFALLFFMYVILIVCDKLMVIDFII